MPNTREIQVEQRRQLIRLLRIKMQNPNDVIGLDTAIEDVEAEMDDKDIEWVRLKILGESRNKKLQ